VKPLFWITVNKEGEENFTENKEYPILAISRKGEAGDGNTYFLTIDNSGYRSWINKNDCFFKKGGERPLFWVYVGRYSPDYFLPGTKVGVVKLEISRKNLFVDLLLVTNGAPLIGPDKGPIGRFKWVPFGVCRFADFGKGDSKSQKGKDIEKKPKHKKSVKFLVFIFCAIICFGSVVSIRVMELGKRYWIFDWLDFLLLWGFVIFSLFAYNSYQKLKSRS